MDNFMPKKDVFSTSHRLILATHNQGKIQELADALRNTRWTVTGASELGLAAPVEDGGSFTANAFIKANAAALASGLWALADDSGLEVDALGGAPGVESAHFGGWKKLLEVMTHVPQDLRNARFKCVLALVRTGQTPLYFHGICEGTISLEALGDGGFGFDPVFIPAGETRTFAQMTKAEKATLSHRGAAMQKLLAWLADYEKTAND
jgi:XTP/dITP diphosphohydrolase